MWCITKRKIYIKRLYITNKSLINIAEFKKVCSNNVAVFFFFNPKQIVAVGSQFGGCLSL